MPGRYLKIALKVLSVALVMFLGSAASAAEPLRHHVEASTDEEAGRYLVLFGGCNDCHTRGWDISNGKLPTSQWLLGNPIGFQGPWGTTYPANLRLFVQTISERAWVQMFRIRTQNPPMPWMNYHNISDKDLTAIYRFIKSLGPKGIAAPARVLPGVKSKTPYILWVPQGPN
jgi:mono/diheme cytochrome c family protein